MLSAELAHRDAELAALSERLRAAEAPAASAAGAAEPPASAAAAADDPRGALAAAGRVEADDAPAASDCPGQPERGAPEGGAPDPGPDRDPSQDRRLTVAPRAAAELGAPAAAAAGQASPRAALREAALREAAAREDAARREAAAARADAAALREQLALAEVLRGAQAAQLADARAELAALAAHGLSASPGKTLDARGGAPGDPRPDEEGLAEFLQRRLREAGAELAARDAEIGRLRAALAGPVPVPAAGLAGAAAGEAAVAALRAQARPLPLRPRVEAAFASCLLGARPACCQ